MQYAITFSSLRTPTVTNWQVAYNGTNHFWYREDGGRLVHSRYHSQADPYSTQTPLTAHFLFLSKDSDECQACYPVLNDLLQIAKAPDALSSSIVNVNSNSVDFNLRTEGGKPAFWRVDWHNIEESSTFFEPAFESRYIQGLGRVTYDLSSYTNLSWLGTPLSVPSAYNTRFIMNPENVVMTGRVAVVTIQTNVQKDAGFYSVKDLHPRSIWNMDSKSLDKREAKRLVHPSVGTRYRRIRAVFIGLMVAVTGFFTFMMLRNRGSSVAVSFIICGVCLLPACARKKGGADDVTKYVLTRSGLGAIQFGMTEEALVKGFRAPDFKRGSILDYRGAEGYDYHVKERAHCC